jgi:hypothetical protein
MRTLGARVGRWLRHTPTAREDGAVWLALTLPILLLLTPGTPNRAVLGLLMLLTAVLLVSLRVRVGFLAVAALLVAGIVMRNVNFAQGYSDVLTVTQYAIDRASDGLNPYGFGYPQSTPPGAPFPYGPLALLWYLPFRGDPKRLEFAISLGILVLLALRGRPIGLALFALTPALVLTASDNSNDTSAGLLLLITSLLLQRSPLLGGAALGAATAFKPYAAAWLPPLLVWGGLPALGGFVASSVVLWGPAILGWGVGPILTSVALSQAIHPTAYYSLASVVESITGRPASAQAWDRFRLVAGAVTTLVAVPFVRTGRGVLLAGTAIYLVTLFTAFWATHSYVAALAPFLCWHIDDWAGLRGGRVRWPGDPVGRLTLAVDRRWARRGPGSVLSRWAATPTRGGT